MDERQITDWELISACRTGDTHAWERLLGAYERLVFSIPLSYGLSREDAADIVQMTFTALLQSIDILREDSRLAAWLATVARRHTWRTLQHMRHESGPAIEDLEVRIAQPGRADTVERWELVEWLHSGRAASGHCAWPAPAS